ncbi:hypothetical protein HYPSUDRAFT_60044 [Hypholoma sublateritium FD-334 SS-4]|uniref:YMC020W-like alpha/beta hydrolase domain-containing protein n=1 Tax=Hypholoma sublateritium (strain FD-334 SS-4) TaxID=945553 RepID=A0A0D2N1Y6_HYPSF|nr:hypothetical protein HYPSUDRAFT_60044 [Hypholoma sublateritium FD-334 SS-4]
MLHTVFGEALHAAEVEHGMQLEKIMKIPLEGNGTIERRVDNPSRRLTHGSIHRLYTKLLANGEWITDLHAADAIIVVTHSQGSIVSTHLLDCLIRDGHIVAPKNVDAVRADALKNIAMAAGEGGVGGGVGAGTAGIHLGPLRYLSSSTLVGPYLQYFESTAARELFEFQMVQE